MKTLRFAILTVYIGFVFCGSLYAQREQTIIVGGKAGWSSAETKKGIAALNAVRPQPVLVLSSDTSITAAGYLQAAGVWGNFAQMNEPALDLLLSFNENNARSFNDGMNRYRVVSAGVASVEERRARAGTGAAMFSSGGNVKIYPNNKNALFSASNRIRDFSIEFWLYPFNMDNGEQILTWIAVFDQNKSQRILCYANKNRLSWSFTDFFASTDGTAHINLEFTSGTPVLPKEWSHHLIRFDASTGLLEYVVNGASEAIVYATKTGRENGEVFTPIAGINGSFTLGDRFVGMIDEFKIHEVCAGRTTIQKYPVVGGRMETRAIDLGYNNSGVLKVNASGGRVSVKNRFGINEFRDSAREPGRFRFSDDAELSFYIRSNDNAFKLNDESESPWRIFTPGAVISDVRGRFVQIRVDFYPSKEGETSPYLNDLQIVYLPGEPPLPPRNVTAVAVDGGVLLKWKNSPSPDTAGYRIYYSSVHGELFGNDALLGSSPINAGYRNEIFIEGLKNGTLYYFRIAAYDEHNVGEFSAEITARPLAGLTLSEVIPKQ